MIDRRVSARRRVRSRALADLGSRVVEGLLLDVGETGAWLALPTSVEAGRSIKVAFQHPERRDTVSAAGLVTRCVRLDIPQIPPFGLGVEFEVPVSDLLAERPPRSEVPRVPLMLRGRGGLPERGVLINVSGTGLLVFTQGQRRREEQVELELQGAEVGLSARLSATVQWVKAADASGCVASGMRVTDFPSRQDRVAFATWVAENTTQPP